MMRFVLIGRSRAGRSVAAALRAAGLDWTGTWNRSSFVPEPDEAPAVTLDAPGADLHVLAVADDALAEVADRLAAEADVRRVIHLSGAAGATPLDGLAVKGASVGFVHPVRSFPAADLGGRGLEGCHCGVSLGDDMGEVLAALERCGAVPFAIPAGAEVSYHAACTIAANLSVALLDVALAVWRRSGLAEEAGRRLLADLVMRCADVAARDGASAALTGPAARGDADVLQSHLDALSGREREIYRLLTLQAVELAHRADDLDELRRLLDDADG